MWIGGERPRRVSGRNLRGSGFHAVIGTDEVDGDGEANRPGDDLLRVRVVHPLVHDGCAREHSPIHAHPFIFTVTPMKLKTRAPATTSGRISSYLSFCESGEEDESTARREVAVKRESAERTRRKGRGGALDTGRSKLGNAGGSRVPELTLASTMTKDRACVVQLAVCAIPRGRTNLKSASRASGRTNQHQARPGGVSSTANGGASSRPGTMDDPDDPPEEPEVPRDKRDLYANLGGASR